MCCQFNRTQYTYYKKNLFKTNTLTEFTKDNKDNMENARIVLWFYQHFER